MTFELDMGFIWQVNILSIGENTKGNAYGECYTHQNFKQFTESGIYFQIWYSALVNIWF